jgi:hypothetical protein
MNGYRYRQQYVGLPTVIYFQLNLYFQYEVYATEVRAENALGIGNYVKHDVF